ncbi:bifunctional riboflavin kinase/FAD synthetase [Foetidibacter luteolus]|uniref:bifunctional riboflavin kinase/FAD synthetase n=1 Tax=Foetidibacter luteolus TaxID=2608880 RepID=UPI00129B06DB|nr:bifunctional riboflavin kinase/FAD synthetase [Foetidibacter luteolus]
MQVHRDLELLPLFKNAVVTIGTFDGVHLGHQQIITQLKEEAARINGETVIITFHPHPRKIVHDRPSIHILSVLQEKIALLQAKGIDHLVVIPFNETFADQTAEAYIRHFLFEKFHPHTVIIGYDHKFGKNRRGDYHLLEEYGAQLGFEVKEIPEHVLNNVTISSTRIREALLKSDLATANNYLGYDYFFEGLVVDGNKLGRTLGYPTANLHIQDNEKLVPGNGIYVVEAEIVSSGLPKDDGNESYPPLATPHSLLKGMMSIGIRPTINGKNRVIEVNLFDFNSNIYGQTLRVYVKKYLREELKFNSLGELTAQLHKDKLDSLAFFNIAH